jgi:hypothetical protein
VAQLSEAPWAVAEGPRLVLPPVPSSEATGGIGAAIIIGATVPAGFVHQTADLIGYRIVIAVDAYRLPFGSLRAVVPISGHGCARVGLLDGWPA